MLLISLNLYWLLNCFIKYFKDKLSYNKCSLIYWSLSSLKESLVLNGQRACLLQWQLSLLCPLSVSAAAAAIQKMTRVRVVDNSSLGNTPYHRAPRVIHVYTKNGVGKVGDRVLLAIKGQKKKALIVGHKMPGSRMTPRFDSNNVVLIEDNGNPTGTRIKVPVPTHLRKMEGDYSKVLAIASSFVWFIPIQCNV